MDNDTIRLGWPLLEELDLFEEPVSSVRIKDNKEASGLGQIYPPLT